MNKYALLGSGITHTLSPALHNILSDIYKFPDFEYTTADIKKDELVNFAAYAKNNLCGFNVTIPFKQEIMPLLDDISSKASAIGAVNTVKVSDGKLLGFNTDIYGFEKSLEINSLKLSGNVLLLGTGGAAKTVGYSALSHGCNLFISSRSHSSFANYKNYYADIFRNNFPEITPYNINSPEEDIFFDFIINTTPVGMHPHENEIPVDKSIIQKTKTIYDIIYNPLQTKLLGCGAELHKNILCGLDMLILQGLKSEEIWQKINIKSALNSISDIRDNLQKLLLN